MPWRPPSVGDKTPYDHRWQMLRAATIRSEPLCRLCLSAGKTVAATVVDHIKPLQDGGTHTPENLMPLCKRCHDAIKTPADKKARLNERTQALTFVLLDPCSICAIDGVIDLIGWRSQIAKRIGWKAAHSVMRAAAEGLAQAAQRGEVPNGLRVAIDEASICALCKGRYASQVVTVEQIPQTKWSNDAERNWIEGRQSNATAQKGTSNGTQSERHKEIDTTND